MQLHFLGANQQVTGSRYCLETASDKILIDCGMFQERPYLDRNWMPSPVRPRDIRAMVLTHVHVDHCGLIPRLVNEGFRGPIYCTHPSVDLAEVILRDAARIQSEDLRFKKKRHAREGRRGRYPELALFTEEDVVKTLPLLHGVPYGRPVPVADGVVVTFHDAGHILGSAMLEFRVRQPSGETCLIFSGDIGQWGQPLLRDPTLFAAADYVVMESTYGDRDHGDHGAVEDQLEEIVQDTLRRGGNLVIPVFAVERAGAGVPSGTAGAPPAHSPCRHVPRQPHGRRRDGDFPEIPAVFRRGDLGVDHGARAAPAVPRAATGPVRRGIEDDQRPADAEHHHGAVGDVHRRSDQASPAAQRGARRVDHPVCRLPGPRDAGATTARRPPGRSDPRPRMASAGADSTAGRRFGPCRP